MAILRGHFAMMLVVTTPDHVDADAFAEDLQDAARVLDLEAFAVREVVEAGSRPQAVPSLVVAVHGADHPGILAAISRALADAGVNVCDLNTRLVGEEEGRPLYVMLMEVAPPAGLSEDALRERLERVAALQGVEVALQPLEADVL
jgi:glycine cleavage system transcriptional repressor